jgi:hypothetical protein
VASCLDLVAVDGNHSLVLGDGQGLGLDGVLDGVLGSEDLIKFLKLLHIYQYTPSNGKY